MAVEVEAAGQVDEFIKVLRRRIWWILLPLVVIGSLGIFVAVVIPKKFVSRTKVMVRNLDEATGELGEKVAKMEGGVARFNLESHARIDTVLNTLRWQDYRALSDADRREYREDLLEDLGIKLQTMAPDSGQQVVDIWFQHTDRGLATGFLSALSKSWQDEVLNRHLERKEKELAETNDRLAENRKRVQSITVERTAIRTEFGISPAAQLGDLRFGASEHQSFTRYKQTEAKIAELTEVIAEARFRYDLEYRAWAAMDKFAAPDEDAPKTQLEKELEKLDDDIFALQLSLQDKNLNPIHSEYRATERRIAVLEESRRSLIERADRTFSEPDTVPLSREWVELDKQLKRDLAEIEANERKLASLVSAEEALKIDSDRVQAAIRDIENLDIDVNALNMSIMQLQQKRDSLDISVRALDSDQGNPFDVLEQPTEPTRPSSPNPYIIGIGAIVAGLGLGLGLAVLKEYSRSCFRSARELSRVMTHPVLGTINMIRTRRERARAMLVRGILAGGSLFFTLAVGYVTWAYGTDNKELLTDSLVEAIDSFHQAMK